MHSKGKCSFVRILQALLLNISIRRTKQHKVNNKKVIDLPDKNIFIQYIEMSEDEKKLYQTFQDEGKSILERFSIICVDIVFKILRFKNHWAYRES